MADWKATLAQKVQQHRLARAEGLREYAAGLGMSPATLSRIERGKGCDVATLIELHNRTGMAIAVMLGANR
jgi:transcriptional regulator with XRE-family HTH domain